MHNIHLIQDPTDPHRCVSISRELFFSFTTSLRFRFHRMSEMVSMYFWKERKLYFETLLFKTILCTSHSIALRCFQNVEMIQDFKSKAQTFLFYSATGVTTIGPPPEMSCQFLDARIVKGNDVSPQQEQGSHISSSRGHAMSQIIPVGVTIGSVIVPLGSKYDGEHLDRGALCSIRTAAIARCTKNQWKSTGKITGYGGLRRGGFRSKAHRRHDSNSFRDIIVSDSYIFI